MQRTSQEITTSLAGLRARTAVRALTALGITFAVASSGGVAEAQRQPRCEGFPATIIAGPADTIINGTPGDDVILGNRRDNVIRGGGGDDIICGGGGDDQIFGEDGRDILFGANGDDLIDGGSEEDRIFGESGDDTIDGDTGNDVLDGGRGADRFVWNPGDGSDVIEAQGGKDELAFNGSDSSEIMSLVQDGERVRLSRSVGTITMDIADVERFVVSTAGGSDTISIGELDPTIVKSVSIDLAATAGAGTGDGQTDRVAVDGSNEADELELVGAPGLVTVEGLAIDLEVVGAESTDGLTLNALGGDDTIDASLLANGSLVPTMNGGLGNDVFVGGPDADIANGGDGDDLALLGSGDDTFVWNPGDDDDTVEGQLGFDTLQFNGSNAAEAVDLSANGGRLRFFRNVANVTMDTDDVEAVRFAALGGADTVVVSDLSGTDVVEVDADLGIAIGSQAGDGQPDTVIANGTQGDDVALVVGAGTEASLLGFAAQVDVTGVDAVGDRLIVNLLAGDDVLEASGLAASGIDLAGDGGADDDVLVGGDGNDVLSGGAGDDVLLGGPGIDVLDGGTGDNVVIQG